MSTAQSPLQSDVQDMTRKKNTPPSGSAGKRKKTTTRTATKTPAKAVKKQPAKQAAKPAAKSTAKNQCTDQGKVPQGRTLTTNDSYLPGGKITGSKKTRPVVVIEANEENELAVVPLSSRQGKNRTKLKNYQQGQSYFKHFVEIEDDEGRPIKVNKKFRENHPNMDVSNDDVKKIKDKVLNHSKAGSENKAKIEKLRKK